MVDSLPFEHELTNIALLNCGDKCIDAGLRAPKSSRPAYNKWSTNVNNAVTHCMIQWPNWTGIFDNQGQQRDSHGEVVEQGGGGGFSITQEGESSEQKSLTSESLDTKDLQESLENKSRDSFEDLGPSSVASTRGSPVPTSSAEPGSSPTPTGEGDSFMVLGAGIGGIQGAVDDASKAAADDSSPVGDTTSTLKDFSQKVRKYFSRS